MSLCLFYLTVSVLSDFACVCLPFCLCLGVYIQVCEHFEQVLRTDASLNSTCGLRGWNESGNRNKLEIEGEKDGSEGLEESEDRGVEGREGSVERLRALRIRAFQTRAFLSASPPPHQGPSHSIPIFLYMCMCDCVSVCVFCMVCT